jgi:hypothetical protein
MDSEDYGLFLDFFHKFDSSSEFYYKELMAFDETLLRKFAMFWYKDNWRIPGATVVYQICVTDYDMTEKQRLYITGLISRSYQKQQCITTFN